jgi:hypothetical protein
LGNPGALGPSSPRYQHTPRRPLVVCRLPLTPDRTRPSGRLPLVLVAKPQPPGVVGLVAALGRAVEPLVHAVEAVHATGVRRVGVAPAGSSRGRVPLHGVEDDPPIGPVQLVPRPL